MKYKIYGLTMAVAAAVFTMGGCGSSASDTSVTVTENSNTSDKAEAAGTPAGAVGESQAATAEALVADLYKQHDGKKSPFFQSKNRGLVDKYFTKTLADMIWKDAATAPDDGNLINADPLYNAQDTDIKDFAVGNAAIKNETATVPVSFANFGARQTITFAMKRVGDAWKIDDIKYGADDSLMKWLKDEPSPMVDSDGEFEGKFRVGDTTCTVKPVRMAFEVRWAKGSGVEMFYFAEGTTFESEGEEGERNKFIFDDENYNSGTFVRSDDRTLSVTRVK